MNAEYSLAPLGSDSPAVNMKVGLLIADPFREDLPAVLAKA